MEHVHRMSVSELTQILDDPTKVKRKDFWIIDVRDDDVEDGHLPGALHLPSELFASAGLHYLAHLLESGAMQANTQVVFHCALSSQRGPYCATLFYKWLQDQKETIRSQCRVCILAGGFVTWSHTYHEKRLDLIVADTPIDPDYNVDLDPYDEG